MVKMILELDKEKIVRDGIIPLQEVEDALQEDFSSRGIYKDEHGFYVGGSFFGFGGLMSSLWDSELFVSYVKEWKWYNSDRSDDDSEFIVEDILAYVKNGKSWEGIPNGVYVEKSFC